MDLQKISNILHNLFQEGYVAENFTIESSSPLNAIITHDNAGVFIKFTGNLPSVKIKKFITFTLHVEGISFGKNSGIIKIKNFPDMPFSYQNDSSDKYGQVNIEDVPEEEIAKAFASQSKRKIASKCLHYAKAWATIASLNGVRFDSCDKFDAFVLKQKCYYFVEDAIKKDKEIKYGSFISIFILSLILPSIIKWAVDRIIRSLLN